MCLAVLAACGAPEPPPQPPLCRGCNVVLVTVDTLRRDHLGSYGYERATTPALDTFFARGTIYDNATTSAPCTNPAVLQTLTGSVRFEPARQRLAERLGEAGYRTAAFVSQALFYDEDTGLPKPAYARGFDTFAPPQRPAISANAQRISDDALAWLDEAGDGPPFFLWLHYYDPHDPYNPPPAFRQHAQPGRPYLDHRQHLKQAIREHPTPGVKRWYEAGHLLSGEDIDHLVGMYDGEIAYADSQIARVLERLDALDDVVVLFSADHGERLGEEQRWDHCQSLRSWEIDVPLMVRVRDAGLAETPRVATAVSTLDIVPTVLSLVGVAFEASGLDGRTLSSLPEDRRLVHVYYNRATVIDRDWKLRVVAGKPSGLYRIGLDPDEERDRLDEEPQLARTLYRTLERYRPAKEVEQLTERTRDELRAIGYIE